MPIHIVHPRPKGIAGAREGHLTSVAAQYSGSRSGLGLADAQKHRVMYGVKVTTGACPTCELRPPSSFGRSFNEGRGLPFRGVLFPACICDEGDADQRDHCVEYRANPVFRPCSNPQISYNCRQDDLYDD